MNETFPKMAGIYSKKLEKINGMIGKYSKKSEEIGGHDVWKHDAYNYDKYVISYDIQKGWSIRAKITKGEGIYGPSSFDNCPSLVGNNWRYTTGKENIYTASKMLEGGQDIQLKCLGMYLLIMPVGDYRSALFLQSLEIR